MNVPGGTASLLSDPGASSAAAGRALDAFGVHVRCDLPLVGAGPKRARLSGRTVQIAGLAADALDEREGEAVLERSHADGSLGMRVTRLGDGSYRIDAPGHGRFEVNEDGSRISYDRLADARWRWHRPLCAQALPLAATLQGLELLHASAVGLDGQAVAFSAQSGGGKTSLAFALLARGASLMTDDVLALEPSDHGVLAHPGVPMANVAAEQLELLPVGMRARLGAALAVSDKVHLEIANLAPGPLPLGAVIFVRRSERIERLGIERIDPPDPRDLLAATFMPHIVTPARLATQLTTCAALAATVPIFTLSAPLKVSAADLAAAVERRLS